MCSIQQFAPLRIRRYSRETATGTLSPTTLLIHHDPLHKQLNDLLPLGCAEVTEHDHEHRVFEAGGGGSKSVLICRMIVLRVGKIRRKKGRRIS